MMTAAELVPRRQRKKTDSYSLPNTQVPQQGNAGETPLAARKQTLEAISFERRA